eukprot:scaffold9624_cov19-Tisochrysis_lutea.AAC.1
MQAQWTTPTKPEIRLLLPVIGVAHFEARTGAWGSVSNGSAALPPLSRAKYSEQTPGGKLHPHMPAP